MAAVDALQIVRDREPLILRHAVTAEGNRKMAPEVMSALVGTGLLLIIESKPLGQYTGFVMLAGLKSENRSIEFMRIVVTNKGKGYGRATVRAIKRRGVHTVL